MKMTRAIRVCGDVAYVTLTRGYEAVIDADDVALVQGADWCALCRTRAGRVVKVYAYRGQKVPGTKKVKGILMHRFLLKAPAGIEVDHIDGNGLNNQRKNLRLATRFENQQNCPKPVTNTSGAKGASMHKATGKWVANIRAHGKQHHLGLFNCRTAAAVAYAVASTKLHGEFGRTK
jgi:HNH endonuclease